MVSLLLDCGCGVAHAPAAAVASTAPVVLPPLTGWTVPTQQEPK